MKFKRYLSGFLILCTIMNFSPPIKEVYANFPVGTPSSGSSSGGNSGSSSGGRGSSSGGNSEREESDIIVNVEVNNNSNTTILDLAKFSINALPYELDLMKDYIKTTPEYKYGDIIEFSPQFYTLKGRDYIEYEEPLISEGIIRYPSDISYSLSGRYFTWKRDSEIKFDKDTLVNKTLFLTSLARNAGIIDNILISARTEGSMIADKNGMQTRKLGTERIEESPYQKEVQGQVDIGENIVLVDYTHGEYLVTRLDNIYKPYIVKLLEMNVINYDEIACTNGINFVKNNFNSDFNLFRANYNSIDVSSPIVNSDSTKDFSWQNQVTVRNSVDVNGNKVQYPIYQNYSYDCGHDHIHNEYTLTGNLNSSNFELEARIPTLMKNESLTVLDGLEYLYKYMWYNEKEETLNQLEVDTVTSLYGIKLTNYTHEQSKVLKYLIAKGIIDPYEDNLEVLDKQMQYKDMVKYLYRLNFPEKRFDFKKLTLTADDIRMASLGYSQDTIKYYSNSDGVDTELEDAKIEAIADRSALDSQIGYNEIYLEIPKQEIETGNYVLSSSQSYNVNFQITPITGNDTLAVALIPKTFTKPLVLRSPSLTGGYEIRLDSWKNGGIYRIKNGSYYLSNSNEIALKSELRLNRFASGVETKLQVNPNKQITYNNIPIFTGDSNNRILNTDTAIQQKFSYDGNGGLVIKDITSLEELKPILSNITAPPTTSSGEVSFMGYSQVNVNGLKLTLIKSSELAKFGIEILEDNVLYNRTMDTYTYLDMRNSLMYYGNTVVKFPDNSIMVEGVAGQESTFYNLEIVKTMLRVVANESIANEIITGLPPDKQYEVADENGVVNDKFYAHTQSNGTMWLNTAVMRNKNSNFIFFRDLRNSLNLLVNYRARVINSEGSNVTTNNNYKDFIEFMKYSGIENHESANALLQTILGYNGSFTNKNYNYGVTILYEIEGNGSNTGVSQEVKNLHRRTSFYSLMNLFKSPSELKKFMGAVKLDSTFTGWGLKSDILGEDYKDITVGDFIKESQTEINNSIYETVFLSLQEVLGEGLDHNNDKLPAKIWNNNLYFRFRNANRFEDIDNMNSPYRLLTALTYLYEFDSGKSQFNIKYEKVNYDSTPTGYVPLENWDKNYSIGNYSYLDKIVIKRKGNDNTLTPYIFDRIVPTSYKDVEPILISVDRTLTREQTLDMIYSELLESNSTIGSAMQSSIVKNLIRSDNSFKETYISKSMEGSSNIDTKTQNWVMNNINGLGNFFGNLIGGIGEFFTRTVKVTEKDILNKDFVFEKNKKYIINPVYLYPSGTTLVKTGLIGNLYQTNNSYSLEVSPNPRPRTLLNNTYDLVNQNLAQLNSEFTNISEMAVGDVLVLASGVELIHLGDSEFIFNSPQKLQSGIDSEEVLMWRYLEDLNIRIGTSLNLLNGVTQFRLPSYNELSSKYGTQYYELMNSSNTLKSSSIVYTLNNLLRSGTFKDTKIKEDKDLKASAYTIPIITLTDKITVVKVRNNESSKGVYLMKSLNESVDMNFVSYLMDGILDVNSRNNSGIIDANSILVDTSMMNNSMIKNMLLKVSSWIEIALRSLPIILFAYSMISLFLLVALYMDITRNILDAILPDKARYLLLRVFSMFSYDEYLDLNFKSATVKSLIVMALSIIWWAWVNN